MPMFKALKLCPDAVVIRPDFAKYVFESRRIMTMMRELTPLVQPLSLDEAWLDLSGSERLHGGPPAWTLARLQRRIEAETGLTVSVGLAPNKVLAKIASELDKPRGIAAIGAAEARAFLADRPVTLLPGVGPRLRPHASARGVSPALASWRRPTRRLWSRRSAHRGCASTIWRTDATHERSIRLAIANPSAPRRPSTRDIRERDALEDHLWFCCEKAAGRARVAATAGRVVTLKLKTADFQTLTRRRTLAEPSQTARTVFRRRPRATAC